MLQEPTQQPVQQSQPVQTVQQTNNTLRILDEETNQDIVIDNPNFYGPAVSLQDQGYTDDSCTIDVPNEGKKQVSFTFPDKPVEEHELAMWNTLDQFENQAWQKNNTGIKTGFDTIDKAFEGGLFPGFIILGGDSNLGKSAMISQMAWQVATLNSNVYVMDFSLDDAMPDKLARVAASSGRLIINAVKTPRNYLKYPLMLIRRKKAILALRENVDKYRAYDSTFSTYIEDIEEEIESKLIYFDSQGKKTKLVVFIDNFHDLNIESAPKLTDKEKYDRLAQWCADLAIKHNITIVCSAELKKLNGNRRAVLDDIREAVKIKYEAKAVLLVYNEVHYKGDGADIYFNIQGNPHKQPIFEVHFAKNKFGSYKGRNFFEFYPSMAYLKECSPQAQQQYSQIVYG